MKRLLVTDDVAALLHCSKRSVQAAVAAGTIPHKRLPGMRRILFDEDELLAALNGAELETVELPRGGRVCRVVQR